MGEPRVLRFAMTDRHDVEQSAASLKIQNTTDATVTFKMRTNDPLSFNVWPSHVGFVRPADRRTLTVRPRRAACSLTSMAARTHGRFWTLPRR
jgi:hypothetical protein